MRCPNQGGVTPSGAFLSLYHRKIHRPNGCLGPVLRVILKVVDYCVQDPLGIGPRGNTSWFLIISAHRFHVLDHAFNISEA